MITVFERYSENDRQGFVLFLIAPPGSLRHGFAVLLTALGTDQQIHQFDTIRAALQQESNKSPTLILCDAATLDYALVDELVRLRSRWPQARLVVMNSDEELAAQLAGSATIVTTGTAAARLRTILSNLLRDMRGFRRNASQRRLRFRHWHGPVQL